MSHIPSPHRTTEPAWHGHQAVEKKEKQGARSLSVCQQRGNRPPLPAYVSRSRAAAAVVRHPLDHHA